MFTSCYYAAIILPLKVYYDAINFPSCCYYEAITDSWVDTKMILAESQTRLAQRITTS